MEKHLEEESHDHRLLSPIVLDFGRAGSDQPSRVFAEMSEGGHWELLEIVKRR
jgi:hypothetical protein